MVYNENHLKTEVKKQEALNEIDLGKIMASELH